MHRNVIFLDVDGVLNGYEQFEGYLIFSNEALYVRTKVK